MRITLTNDFHNTEITLNCKNGRISARQMKKARNALCSSDCACSGEAGYRGYQDDFDGIEPTYDGRTGMLTGGIVHFHGETDGYFPEI